MNKLKLIVALTAGLFAFTSVNAGEMSVTGSMHVTYQSEVDDVTGNPLGMNTDLTFSGSTDTDFGTATWTMGTDGTFLGDSGADHTFKIATDLGTIGVGNSGDAANAVTLLPNPQMKAFAINLDSKQATTGCRIDAQMQSAGVDPQGPRPNVRPNATLQGRPILHQNRYK